MTQNTSLANFALTQEQFFAITEKDNALAQVGKFTIATVVTTSSFALAVAETALSAIAQIALLPLWIVSRDGYSQIGKHTSDSAATMVLAARRTFGMLKTDKTDDSKVQNSLGEKLKEVATDISGKLGIAKNYITTHGIENKRATIAIALTVSLTALYFFYPEQLFTEIGEQAGSLWISGKETVSWGWESAANATTNAGTWLVETFRSGAHSVSQMGTSIKANANEWLPIGSNPSAQIILHEPIPNELKQMCVEEVCPDEGMVTEGQLYGTVTAGMSASGLATYIISRA